MQMVISNAKFDAISFQNWQQMLSPF